MKKYILKITLCVVTLVMAMLLLSSCGSSSNNSSFITDEQREEHILKLLDGDEDNKIKTTRYPSISSSKADMLGITSITGMSQIMSNSKYTLYMDLKDTSIAIYDKTTKNIYHSDPSNINVLEESGKSQIASPILLEAYDSLNKRYEFNFYENCYGDGNFVIAELEDENGEKFFRLIYTIGNDPNKDLAPPVLTEETFDRLYATLEEEHPESIVILKTSYKKVTPDTITLEEKESLLQYYPTLDWQTLYVRRSLTTRQRSSLTQTMKLAGFTAEQVKEEIEKTEYQGPERSVMYTIPVDLKLTDYGLEATVDSSLILAPAEQKLYKVSLYRGLGANDAPSGNEYMLVPDGSGAIIPARGELSTEAYSERVYGNDETFAKDLDVAVEESALTAFGVYDRDSAGAMVAIMTEGASQSLLSARPLNTTSNLATSLNYEFIYAERDYRTYMSEKSSTGTTAQNAVNTETGTGVVLSKDSPDFNFTVQYHFLEGGKTYSDYATFYREYLIEEGILPGETTEEDGVSLYLDLLGAIDRDETVVGFPVVQKRALTTYNQAAEILTKLSESGVDNIKARYSYWTNGGYYNTVFNTVRLIGEMGSQADLKNLVALCQEKGVDLYPTAEFMYLYRETIGDGFDFQVDVSRRLDLAVARLGYRSAITGQMLDDNPETVKSIISADVLPGYAESYKASYDSVTGLPSISLGAIGEFLNTNYKTNRIINREQALEIHTQILETYKDYDIAVSNGNDYTWKYADAIYSIPMGSSENVTARESIPFIQMVLHGYVSYAGEAFNVSGDYQTELLQAIETGSNISFRWMYEENTVFDNTTFYDFYSVNYNFTYDKAVEMYKELNEVMKDVVNLPITNHEKVDATYTESGAKADRVYATTYGDVKTFYVNYNSYDVTLSDGTVVAAQNYTWR